MRTTSVSRRWRSRSADVVAEEKVERINRALDEQKRVIDELTLAAQRPALGHERAVAPAIARAQAGLRPLCPPRRRGWSRRAGGEGALGGIQPGRRLYRAARDRGDDRPRAGEGVADPLHRDGAADRRQRVSQADHHRRRRDRLGGRDRQHQPDQHADSRSNRLPGDGALRHARRDADAARRQRRRHRTLAGGRGADRVRRTGRRRLRGRRRQQQADRLPAATPTSPMRRGRGAVSAISRAGPRARSRRPIRRMRCSISPMRRNRATAPTAAG